MNIERANKWPKNDKHCCIRAMKVTQSCLMTFMNSIWMRQSHVVRLRDSYSVITVKGFHHATFHKTELITSIFAVVWNTVKSYFTHHLHYSSSTVQWWIIRNWATKLMIIWSQKDIFYALEKLLKKALLHIYEVR